MCTKPGFVPVVCDNVIIKSPSQPSDDLSEKIIYFIYVYIKPQRCKNRTFCKKSAVCSSLRRPLCIITQDKSAAGSEVAQFLRQSGEEVADEVEAAFQLRRLDDSRTRVASAVQREGASPHDPPDMKADISSLITMKHDDNDWTREGRRRTETREKKKKNDPKGRGRKRDQRAS